LSKTFIIFKHEFLYTIRRVGFIILTLAFPVLALLGIGIFHFTSGLVKGPAEINVIGYVDEAGDFDQYTDQGKISLVRFETVEAATQALIKDQLKEYFVIPPDYASKGVITRYTIGKQLTVPPEITTAIKNFLSSNLLTEKIPDATVKIIESPLNVVNITLTSTGAVSPEQGSLMDLVVPGIFSLLLALSLTFSSAYVVQGLGEEKENRVLEILLSSVSTRQLIVGKVFGIGLAGLVQVVFWAVLMPSIVNVASSSLGGLFSSIRIPANFLVLGVVYFLLGYLLFAVLSATIAAVTSNVREGQGLASIFTLFAVAPFWFYSLLFMFPNHPIWIVFSFFPFSAPVLVMLRFGMTGVPAWQLAASITVMLVSIVLGLMLAAKLLRTNILMYGKKLTLREIIRNLRST
jgi:ABC-2 type transport system permease protein